MSDDINRILVPDAPPEYEDHTRATAAATGIPLTGTRAA